MVDTVAWKTKSKVDFDLRDDIKRCYFSLNDKLNRSVRLKRTSIYTVHYVFYLVIKESVYARMIKVLDWWL